MEVKLTGLKESLDTLQTGDILLFSGAKFWFSKLIRFWTKSKFTHTAMILRDPIYISPELTGLYLWESGIEPFPDSEDHVKKLGVQITSLDEYLEDEPDVEFIVHRKLNTNYSKKYIEDKIKDIHLMVHNKPYDINICDFLMASVNVKYVEEPEKPSKWAIMNWLKPNHTRNDTYFCSGLVGFIYTYLGLLPSSTKWTECTPAFFSSEENPNMSLTVGNYLEVDKLLYQKTSK